MTVLIVMIWALIAGFQIGAGWVINRGYGPFLWGFTHPFSRRPEVQADLAEIQYATLRSTESRWQSKPKGAR
ncbi:hypothetical protein A5720_27975 [Mycolicibacterium conceptionense]|uniref:Uncharacterized protein n=1 Tax=Mycolicibacterium conceptionense TaxID=451644 RepID=A0A1A2V8Y1_9MYCO|nr:hypothetical protein A5726_25070 [Mycolicibacterium conceptionense]OBF31674.1 hypothetical protein A5720_27975 [Mycolicibacterium conceptionense]OBH97052.1 hypothetical protein A5716_16950 [Mycolicibacterium conceptionense]